MAKPHDLPGYSEEADAYVTDLAKRGRWPRIIVRKRAQDWRAFLAGSSGDWAVGATAHAAIGNLVVGHGDVHFETPRETHRALHPDEHRCFTPEEPFLILNGAGEGLGHLALYATESRAWPLCRLGPIGVCWLKDADEGTSACPACASEMARKRAAGEEI